MKNKNSLYLRFLTRGALIAALYTALTLVSALFNLSSGAIQFRLSESLCLLPLIMPEAVPGLFVGCLLSNFVLGCEMWDVVLGSLATLIGAYLGRLLYIKTKCPPIIATLPTTIANALIIPPVLILVYGSEGSYLFFAITVTIGELVCATLLGSYIYKHILTKLTTNLLR